MRFLLVLLFCGGCLNLSCSESHNRADLLGQWRLYDMKFAKNGKVVSLRQQLKAELAALDTVQGITTEKRQDEKRRKARKLNMGCVIFRDDSTFYTDRYSEEYMLGRSLSTASYYNPGKWVLGDSLKIFLKRTDDDSYEETVYSIESLSTSYLILMQRSDSSGFKERRIIWHFRRDT